MVVPFKDEARLALMASILANRTKTEKEPLKLEEIQSVRTEKKI